MSATLSAQFVHGQSDNYVWPDEPAVKQKLEHWQDLKFGMIIHWGLYAVPGIVESWSICSEDEQWIPRDSTKDYNTYKQWYWDLSKQFNPVKFNPDQWAQAGRDAGMKYLVFTTKHHDGFCLFDSKETDFSIARGPFKDNPKADAAKYVFEAFRNHGYMIGAYFSKPDWHSDDYWWKRYATPNRNNNYDVRKHSWKWERFKKFTYNQIMELMSNYGSIDILWLDGGWVRSVSEAAQNKRVWSQDIDMPRIAKSAREKQPGLLVVDRTVHGPYENYQTPEQSIPAKQLSYPWETCMTLGQDWGYNPRQRFKSSTRVIHSLIEIVAKGGSLLLGVGPSDEGLLPDEIVSRLQEIGKWTAKNGEAIYGTRTVEHYNDGNVWFTKSKDGKKTYAFVCLSDNQAAPVTVEWNGNAPAKGASMTLLYTGKTVKWKNDGGKITVTLPKTLPAGLSALAFAY
jgi:alpha-L-fucosidase